MASGLLVNLVDRGVDMIPRNAGRRFRSGGSIIDLLKIRLMIQPRILDLSALFAGIITSYDQTLKFSI